MKKFRNKSDRASILPVMLLTGLISTSAILLAIAMPANMGNAARQDLNGIQLKRGTDTDSMAALGNYPDTSILLSSATTVRPDAMPTNDTSHNVITSSCQITQSTSQAITTSFVPCHYGGPMGNGQTDNSYWRAFNMGTLAGGTQYDVSSVSFGVFSVNHTQSITVRLYTNSSAPFPGGVRTQIATSTISVTIAQSGTLLTTPLLATVPAGTSELLMELFTPGAQAAGNRFQVGANTAPETGLSYWSSPCGQCILPMDQHFVFNVNGSCAGGLGSPTPTATATVGPCGQNFAENFDGVAAPGLPPGWIVQTFCSAPTWVTSTVTPDSGPNDVFISHPDGIVGDKRLETPNMTITGPGAQLTFRNSYNLFSGLDGGVLELSSPNINGGAFTDITNPAVGGNFVTGGYNSNILADWGGGASPLSGRAAWSGNSGGYITTIANLGPNVAGQTIRLRFRMGSSFSSTSAGWRIDTVSSVGTCVMSTATPSPTATATATATSTATATATPTSTATSTATVTPVATPTPTSINLSGTISYCSDPVPGPVPDVTLTLTGTSSASTLSDGSGDYQFSSLPNGGSYVVTPSKADRTPGSAGINTVDVIATQRHFLNVAPLPPGCLLMAADVNGDTAVNTADVIAIQRFSLGLTFGLANVGEYQFTPANRSYPAVISDQTGQNYDAIVFGDVASPFATP